MAGVKYMIYDKVGSRFGVIVEVQEYSIRCGQKWGKSDGFFGYGIMSSCKIYDTYKSAVVAFRKKLNPIMKEKEQMAYRYSKEYESIKHIYDNEIIFTSIYSDPIESALRDIQECINDDCEGSRYWDKEKVKKILYHMID